MPGIDHDVHELVRQGAEARYGCYNRVERKNKYWARNVARNLVPPMDVWVLVTDYSSKECRYDLSLKDMKCEGCAHRGTGEAYDAEIRRRGT